MPVSRVCAETGVGVEPTELKISGIACLREDWAGAGVSLTLLVVVTIAGGS